MTATEWDGTPVPVELWGKDHWSTFAYIETRVVDHDGFVDDRQLRGHLHGWERYPTRLRDGAELTMHNDYDCATDAMVAGLLASADPNDARKPLSDEPSARRTWRGARWALTPKGKVVAAKLRAHKGDGGTFATFDPGPVLGWMAAGPR